MAASLGKVFKRPVCRALACVEQSLLARTGEEGTPPIFILGVPRSGTTLLYQLLVHCFETAYFCNAASDHSRYAASVTRLLRGRIRGHRCDFFSRYGRTRGLAGPSEGLDIWRQWFPAHWVSESWLDEAAARRMRATVFSVTRILGAPFVNKDPHHSVRVRALEAVFPGSLYLQVQRHPLDTAASLLALRRRRTAEGRSPDLRTWVSVKPREYPALAKKETIEQICGQVHYCLQNAASDLQVAAGRSLEIRYERLREAPAGELGRVTEFLADHGVQLRQRRRPPACFSDYQSAAQVSLAERAALRKGLDRLCQEAGCDAGAEVCAC